MECFSFLLIAALGDSFKVDKSLYVGYVERQKDLFIRLIKAYTDFFCAINRMHRLEICVFIDVPSI